MERLKARNAVTVVVAAIVCAYLIPTGLAWSASAQSLWIANDDGNNVLQVKPSNSVGSNPLGIAFDKSGNEWVTLYSTAQVAEYTKSQLKDLAATPSPTPHTVITSASWSDLYGCTFDKTQNLWLADESGALDELSHAQLNAGSGTVTPYRQITSTSFDCPQFLAFDKSANLWVSDECNDEIFQFTPAQLKAGGNLVPNVTISGNMSDPGELAFDSSGNLWIASYSSSTVVEFAKSALALSGSPTPNVILSSDASESLDGAWGLAFDASDDLWISDYDTGALVEFTPAQLTSSGDPTPSLTMPGVVNSAYQMNFGPSY